MNKIIYNELDGRTVAYHLGTEFLVQLGRYNSSYKTKYSFKGDLPRAVWFYNSLNVGRGYKKRLLAPSMNKPVLARMITA